MFPKLLATIIGLVVIGSAVLGLRRERIECWHAMADLHRQMDKARQQVWAHQSRISEHTRPDKLSTALSDAGLALTPASSVPDSALADDAPITPQRMLLLPQEPTQ